MALAGILQFGLWDYENEAMVCLVDPEKIYVDAAYQRPHDENHSRRMAAKDVLTPYPICSYRDGKLRVGDGQHRIWKAKHKGKTVIVVLVKFGLTLAQEALLFADLNECKRPDRWITFKAKLIGGVEENRFMKAIANNHGLTLKCEQRNGDLRNTHVMVEAYNNALYENWIKLLCCFKGEDGRLDKRASTNAIEFQRGLLDVLRKYGVGFFTSRVCGVLRQIGIGLIFDSAAEQCHCSRSNRSHYSKAIEGLLIARGLLPITRKAA
jgi:hypothetical protein